MDWLRETIAIRHSVRWLESHRRRSGPLRPTLNTMQIESNRSKINDCFMTEPTSKAKLSKRTKKAFYTNKISLTSVRMAPNYILDYRPRRSMHDSVPFDPIQSPPTLSESILTMRSKQITTICLWVEFVFEFVYIIIAIQNVFCLPLPT